MERKNKEVETKSRVDDAVERLTAIREHALENMAASPASGNAVKKVVFYVTSDLPQLSEAVARMNALEVGITLKEKEDESSKIEIEK